MKLKVLLVDDDEDILEFMREELAPLFSVETAKDGLEGLERYQSFAPDIIIADIVMPGLNGIELIEKIRKDDAVTLITISGNNPKGLQAAREKGADACFYKPFDMDEIIDFIQKNAQH